ncbi:MAG: GNAT family N-acetyltransferase [Acidobacteriota bacterium]
MDVSQVVQRDLPPAPLPGAVALTYLRRRETRRSEAPSQARRGRTAVPQRRGVAPATGQPNPGCANPRASTEATPDFDLRWATTEDERAAVYRLRYELYVADQGLFTDVADHARRWLTDEYDAVSRVALAEIDGEVVGTVRVTFGDEAAFSDGARHEYDFARFAGVVDEGDIGIITRFLVRKEYRGNGILSFQLLWKAFECCAVHGLELLLGTCEAHLMNRYRTLGFQPYGKLYNHPTSGALVPIAIVFGDLAHMQRIGSPMASAIARRTKPHDEVDAILPLVRSEERAIKSRGHDAESHWNAIFRWLAGLPGILGDLTQDEASVLLAKSHILDCQPGDAIILKGHVSRTLYILLEGTLEVQDQGQTVATVNDRGALVGEVAFFTAGQRMSDVVTGSEGARVLALSAGNLQEIIRSYGPMAAKFLHYAARGLCEKLLERAG